MIKYRKMTGSVRDVLQECVVLDDNFEIVKYDAYEHQMVVPQIYSRTLDKKPLGEKWDQVEGFYPEGVYLILHKEEAYYIGFILSYISEETPYISAIGVMKQYRRRGIGTFLVQKLAQHYAKMGYKDIWIDIRPDGDDFSDRCKMLGFREIGDA